MAVIHAPNTGLIQGVQHFYTATKPTARPNGSALVIGDKWWKVDDGTDWFWNGTYWLSPPFYRESSGNISLPYDYIGYPIFSHYVRALVGSPSGVFDSSNYVTISISQATLWAIASPALETKNLIPVTQIGVRGRPTAVETFLVNYVVGQTTGFVFSVTNVGSPSSLSHLRTAKLSYIYP